MRTHTVHAHTHTCDKERGGAPLGAYKCRLVAGWETDKAHATSVLAKRARGQRRPARGLPRGYLGLTFSRIDDDALKGQKTSVKTVPERTAQEKAATC